MRKPGPRRMPRPTCTCQNPACSKRFQGVRGRANKFCCNACKAEGHRVHSPEVVAYARELWGADGSGDPVRTIARKLSVRFKKVRKRGYSPGVVLGIASRGDFPIRPSPIRRTEHEDETIEGTTT